MKLFKNDVDSFNNLVFEKRNRDYGAYAIRESYNGNASKSILIVSGTFLLLALLLSSFSGTKKMEVENLFNPDDQTKVLSTKPIDITEPKVDQPKPQPASAASKAASFVTFTNNEVDSTNILKANEDQGSLTGKSNNLLANGTNIRDTGNVVTIITNTVTIADPVIPTKPVLWAEVMPKFNGDMVDFIQKNITFPESALSMGVSGTVYISFVVDESGAVTNVKAARGIGYGCDEEAERVVRKMPKWIPGKMGKENVKVMMNLPIKYKTNY